MGSALSQFGLNVPLLVSGAISLGAFIFALFLLDESLPGKRSILWLERLRGRIGIKTVMKVKTDDDIEADDVADKEGNRVRFEVDASSPAGAIDQSPREGPTLTVTSEADAALPSNKSLLNVTETDLSSATLADPENGDDKDDSSSDQNVTSPTATSAAKSKPKALPWKIILRITYICLSTFLLEITFMALSTLYSLYAYDRFGLTALEVGFVFAGYGIIFVFIQA